jgi:hypothetical protein
MDTFAAIWADRRPGENSEDAIIRRKFDVKIPLSNLVHPQSSDYRPPATVGYHDRRCGLTFSEGFEIFRTYKGNDFRAKATSGAWLLLNTGDLYYSLNRLSKSIGAQEDAWHGWRYRDEGGNVHVINELRDEKKITKRRST